MYYKWVGLVIEGDVPEALDDEMGLRLPNGLTRRVWAWEMPPGQVWLLGREDPPPIIAEYP